MAGSSNRARAIGATLWAFGGWLMLLAGFGVGFIDTRANDINCGSAFVASPVDGGALLSGSPADDDVTRIILRTDCAQAVTRQRLIVGVLAVLGGASVLWSRRRSRPQVQRWNLN